MSDAKPYRVSMSGTGRVPWAIEGMKDRIFCFASKDEAEHACEIANIVAAARDGEVGRYKAALEEIAQDEASGYGCYHGGDPRMFHPDSESCTPEELAAHKKACDEWTEAENAAKPSPDAPCPSGWVGPNIHVTVAPFGIGCYTYPSHTALIARSALAPGNGGEGEK